MKTSDISHIENFAHEVIAYTDEGEFRINERLKTLSKLLDSEIFIRISNSVIISTEHIKSIKPAFTQKFIITMRNGAVVDVTRTYYYIFKEFLGISGTIYETSLVIAVTAVYICCSFFYCNFDLSCYL